MNRFTIDENDPRLTAYALGEMPAGEAAEFEKQIQGDAAVGAAIADIRQTALMLQSEFAAEPSPGLSDAHHRAMERRMLHGEDAEAPQPIPISRGRRINRFLLAGAGLAAAACLAIAFVLPKHPGRSDIGEVAVIKDKSSLDDDVKLKHVEQYMATVGQSASTEPENARRSRELFGKTVDKRQDAGNKDVRELQDQQPLVLAQNETKLGHEVQPSLAPSRDGVGAGVGGGAAKPDGNTGTKKEESPSLPSAIVTGGQSGQLGERPGATDEKSGAKEVGQSNAPTRPQDRGKAGELDRAASASSAMPAASPAPPPPPMPASESAEGRLASLAETVNPSYVREGGAAGEDKSRGQPTGDSSASPSDAGESKVIVDSLTQAIVTAPPPSQSSRSTVDDGPASSSGGRGLGRDAGQSGGGAGRPAKQHASPGSGLSGGFYPTDASLQALRQQIDSLSPDQARAALAQVVDALRQAVDQDQANRLRLCQRILAERVRTLGPNTENYKLIRDNPFVRPIGQDALSTFGADVDTASYSNIRRFIEQQGQLPPRDAVRIEEMVNYFSYSYELPSQEKADAPPFSTNVEINAAPWNPSHRLVRIGLKGKEIRQDMRPPTNLVFLIDVSGSMQPANKLPLIKQSLHLLLDRLNGDDMLGIVTYAGNAGMPLDSTYVNDQTKQQIRGIIDGLSAGGSTNGAGGLMMAYEVAMKHFIKAGVNRVILCTDGDFNVGVSGDGELTRLIEEKRNSGVSLSVLGFGSGNLQDAKMEALANNGNGMFAYIDGLNEARKVFVDQMAGTLVTIAKDVKFQVEFNPSKVAAYRQIGYENRKLAAQDFNNDRKDAGEIGAGHTVTVLYEVVPHGVSYDVPGFVDPLKYQQPATKPEPAVAAPAVSSSDELLTVKLRYKEPDADVSKLLEIPVKDVGDGPDKASPDFMFASSVAAFGMILRDSPYRGNADLPSVLDWAQAGRGDDPKGYRADFIRMVDRARMIAPPPPEAR